MESALGILHESSWKEEQTTFLQQVELTRGQFNKEIILVVFTRVIYTCKVRLLNTRIQ